jgi:alpha-tubulin suppressor-like RCC1 family protein
MPAAALAALAVAVLALLALPPLAAALSPEPLVVGTPQVSAGELHSMAVRFDGTLWAWGDDDSVQLGVDYPAGPHPWFVVVPWQVGTDEDWAVVDAGAYHTMALKGDGSLWLWGVNTYGQLGGWTYTKPWDVPFESVDMGACIAIGAGERHSVAIKADGTLWTCGTNDQGQLGRATVHPSDQHEWGQVGSSSDWVAVSAGGAFNLALQKDGSLWAWGSNSVGQLGVGTLVLPYINAPAKVGNYNDWVAVSAGNDHALGVRSGGSLWSWGDNAYGQLGDGTRNDEMEPKRVPGEDVWSKVSAGRDFSAAVRDDGALFSWGHNDHGQLGDHSTELWRTSPVNVGPEAYSRRCGVSAGGDHLLTLNLDGGAWACGANGRGQLGQGTTDESNAFLPVMPLTLRVAATAEEGPLLQTGTGHVTWTTNGKVGAGYFDVYAYDLGDNTYISQHVTATSATSYAVDVPLSTVPVGGPYQFFVAYVPTVGSTSIFGAPGTFSIYAQPAVTITAPTATGSWPSGSTQTVSWNVAPAAPLGQFQVSLVNQATGVWYVNRIVPAVAEQTLYSVNIATTGVPAGSYKAAVYWRPGPSDPWAEKKKSAAFTVTPVNITVPAAGAMWQTQATYAVSWNVTPAMTSGEFLVALVNTATNAWWQNRFVPFVAGRTSHSVNVNTNVPAGTYRAAVYWRATPGSGVYTVTSKSGVFTIAALTVSAPTASSSWPRLSTRAVDWNVAPALAAGEFRVSLVSSTNVWYINRAVPVVPAQTDYSTSFSVAVPAGTYRAAVYWRQNSSSAWLLTKKTAAFAVTP